MEGLTCKTTKNAGRMGRGRQDCYHTSSCGGGGGMVVVWWTISDEWSGTHQRDARFGPCLKSQARARTSKTVGIG
jgi:hypothetical protein